MEHTEITKKLEELGRLNEEFKTAHKSEIADLKKNGQAAMDRIEKTEKLNDKITSLEAEIQGLKAAAARSGKGGEEKTQGDEKIAQYKKAFNQYARKGADVELKTLNVESDVDGGFLVPQEMSSEIVKKIFESSPMRQLASVQTISTGALEILEDLDEVGTGWVGEQQSRPETSTPQIKKIIIPAHEIYAQPKATQIVLDDAAINIEAWLSEKVSSKFARQEATAFVSGDGVMKPKGFLSYGAGDGFGLVEQVNNGHATNLQADGLMDLVSSLKEAYLPNACFLMQRATVKALRKLKDNQNRYLWEPGLNGGKQASILGYEIYQASDMPSIASAALPIAFGDFKQGYQIVDRVGIRIIRDMYSAKPYVLFYTTKRVGGAVKNFEAIKILKMAV